MLFLNISYMSSLTHEISEKLLDYFIILFVTTFNKIKIIWIFSLYKTAHKYNISKKLI